MHLVATVPDLYPLLVELQIIPSLLELLSHENTDIAVAVIDLLQELTDVDILHESQEGADTLIDALLEQQICALLVQNIERLDEMIKEEADGVHNTLGIHNKDFQLSDTLTQGWSTLSRRIPSLVTVSLSSKSLKCI